MITIDIVEALLNEIAEELPQTFFDMLNGGIILLPESKIHPNSVERALYIMGEYHRDRTMGCYIVIYYGSFMAVYGDLSKTELKENLRSTVKHEFRHHFEFMAGEHGLEIKDANDLSEYLQKNQSRVKRKP